MTEKIVQITINPHTKDIISISFPQTSLKFKCQRCTVFCCKCGGPKLSLKDIKNLKRSRKRSDISIDAQSMTLKNRKDGSCTLLASNSDQVFRCSVYSARPTLCRMYPFQLEKLGESSFALNLILCCNGLNAKDGETIDERFFKKYLRKPFLDMLANGQH